LHQGFDSPTLPKEAVTTTSAEIRNLHRIITDLCLKETNTFNLIPQLSLCASIENINLKTAHTTHRGTGTKLIHDRQGRDFPSTDRCPITLEIEYELITFDTKIVFWQLKIPKPFDVLRHKHLILAVESVTSQP